MTEISQDTATNMMMGALVLCAALIAGAAALAGTHSSTTSEPGLSTQPQTSLKETFIGRTQSPNVGARISIIEFEVDPALTDDNIFILQTDNRRGYNNASSSSIRITQAEAQALIEHAQPKAETPAPQL